MPKIPTDPRTLKPFTKLKKEANEGTFGAILDVDITPDREHFRVKLAEGEENSMLFRELTELSHFLIGFAFGSAHSG